MAGGTVDVWLTDAASRGDVAELARLLAAGADPGAREGSEEWTPLQRAACHGHADAIRLLLQVGAREEGASASGWTPLMWAAHNGHTAAIEALLRGGADVNATNDWGSACLHLASAYGSVDAVRMLVAAGANVSACSVYGRRPVDMVSGLQERLRTETAWWGGRGERGGCRVQNSWAGRLMCCPWARARVQVCTAGTGTAHKGSIRDLLARSTPWRRRRAALLGCCNGAWDEI
jgi:hypothetical protein